MDRILCISHSSLDAGAEKAFSEMVKVLSTEGKSVHCIFPNEGPLIEKCIKYMNGYSIIPLPWWFGNSIGFIGKLKLLRKIIISSLNIKKVLRRFNPQKLIINTIAIPSPAIAGFLTSTPIYWFIHELGNDGFHMLFGERFTKKLIGLLAKKVICNSHFTLDHYKTFIPLKKLSYAWQPVNIGLPVKRIIDSIVDYGLVGRLCVQKAQREAAEAMLYMKNEKSKLWLIGADNNQYAYDLKQWISANGLDEKVFFAGETNNIGEIYARLDILVVCSRNESLGRTTIEAMKYGLPVIAPNAFGHSELIQDGYNGLNYQLGNPVDLAAKMEILSDNEVRIKLGANGKDWANINFNDQRYAEMLMESLNS